MSIPICAAPDPNPTLPTFDMPKRACDCHAHVFGPLSDFPMVPDRLYTPPEAPLSSYEHLLTTLGFERSVIVQPSVYGTDNRATLQAVARHPDRYRAVVVVDGNVTPKEIASFHQQGARGVRANLLFSGDKAMADVRAIARIIADFDWHLQVLLDVTTFPDVYAFFDGLPVEVVFDHMGHFPAEKTVNAPGCREMLKLMEKGKAWTKLSGAYRTSAQTHAPYEDVTPIAQAIIQANPDQVVFGTDWPHPHFAKDMPNDGALLDQLPDWAPDPELRQRILVDNPARLYDF